MTSRIFSFPFGQEWLKGVIRAAELRDEIVVHILSAHGGFPEGGDAELIDREMLAQGRHMTVKVLPKIHHAHDAADHEWSQEAAGGSCKRQTLLWVPK